MPTTIPSEQEMLNLASEEKGIPVNELKENITEYSKQFASFLPKKLLTYRYLVDVLEIQPELSVIAPKEQITISRMKESLAKTGIQTAGYLIRNELRETRKKQEPIYFVSLMDNTGVIGGTVYFDKIFKKWEKLGFGVGDYLQVINCGVDEYRDSKTIVLKDSTDFIKVEDPPYSIDDISAPLNSLEEGDFAFIRCMIVVVEDNPPYIGCPHCLKKLTDVDEGQTAECPNENCSFHEKEIMVEELQFMRCYVTDGNDDMRISFNPRIVKEYGMSAFREGLWLEVTGSMGKSNEFRANSVKFSDLFGDSDKQIAKRLPIKELTLESAAEKVAFMLASYDKLPREEFVECITDLMDIDEEKAGEAIDLAVKNGTIKLIGDVYVKVKEE